MTGDEADAMWDEGMLEAGRQYAKSEMRPVKPHVYVPSTFHVGACMICGHIRSALIHRRHARR